MGGRQELLRGEVVKYKIISETDESSVERLVDALLAEGWELFGPLHVTPLVNSRSYPVGYTQALTFVEVTY